MVGRVPGRAGPGRAGEQRDQQVDAAVGDVEPTGVVRGEEVQPGPGNRKAAPGPFVVRVQSARTRLLRGLCSSSTSPSSSSSGGRYMPNRPR